MPPSRYTACGHHARPQRRITQAALLFIIGAGAAAPAIAGNHSAVVTVTAYNSVTAQTDNHPNTGAWGSHLGPHTVAVSPDLIKRGLKRGTSVAIQGYKHNFVIRDKTSSHTHHTLDIYMGKSVHKAREFGKKKLRIWWHTPDK